VKRSKYTFIERKVEYLGHIITGKGVSTNPKKIEAMVGWLRLHAIKELRGIIGDSSRIMAS